MGKYLLYLIDDHFMCDKSFSKIFKRNTITISYLCTNKISKMIYNHNWKLIDEVKLKSKETHKLPLTVELKKNAS